MQNIIVAYSKAEDARRIRSVLVKYGWNVIGVCTAGAQVLSLCAELDEAVVVCGFRLRDMVCSDLAESLPRGISMLLITARHNLNEEGYPDNVVCLTTPLKTEILLDTLEKMTGTFYRSRRKKENAPPVKSEADRRAIEQAKLVLMERNKMTEQEAHRYLQKTAMNAGNKIAETARMILLLTGKN
ncbi:MAG: ANTAR domain-containing protein [Eubacterium sp.]|nr:ANTAR domain-containing protein [Eubacterium sp.]